MSLTSTEQSLLEINQEISFIVARFTCNVTSYFHHIEKLLKVFEAYLESLNLKECEQQEPVKLHLNSFVFTEKLAIRSLAKFQRFLKLLLNWDFAFCSEFKDLLTCESPNLNNQNETYFTDICAKELIFLMYIGLEIQRKQVLGKDFNFYQNKTSLVKEVVQILQDCFQNVKETNDSFDEMCYSSDFIVNEEKLLQKIQQKTLRLKISKDNFSFNPFFSHRSKKFSNIGEKNNKKSFEEVLQKLKLENNGLLVSVQSEFEASVSYGEKSAKNGRESNMKKSALKFERISNEEVFKNISLQRSKP